MLPLDQLDEQARDLLSAHGVDPDATDAALLLDLDFEQKYARSYLVLDAGNRRIYRLTPVSENFEVFDLDLYTDPCVENFTSSNRLLYRCHGEKFVPPVNGTEKEIAAARKTWDATGQTVILGYATNSCKPKLFAFLQIARRLLAGEQMTGEDELFDQFSDKCPHCGLPYPPGRTDGVCPHCSKEGKVLFRILKYYKPFIPQCVFIMLCMMGCSFVSLVTPQVQGNFLYDQVIAETGKYHSEAWVYITVSVILGLGLFNLLIQIFQQRTQTKISHKMEGTLRKATFSKIQALSLSFFGKNATGKLVHRVNNDAYTISRFFDSDLTNFTWHAINFIGMAVFLFTMNWRLTSLIFLPIPAIVCIFKFMLPKIWRMYSRRWRANSALSGMIGDTLSGIRVVKAFVKEVDETHRFRKYSNRIYQLNLKTNAIWLTIFPLAGLLIGLASQVIWGVGGIMVMGQEMTYGQFVTYFGYVGLAFAPLSFFATFSDRVTETINCCQRFFETMDTKPDVETREDPIKVDRLGGDIVFDQVNFSYDPNRPILRDVSLHIRPGEHIGLVGHTGAGKSTIANLITRMYDTNSGTILLDGVNIKDLEPQVLRRNMAIVSQEIFIFRGTVADNIRYAKPDATMAEVIEAARAANAHEFIMEMPQGYDTVVGIGSRAMSGGEQQRISIARALLLAPSILILDEATAAMDTETERMIGKALDRLIEGRTTISIAHRLSTLKGCCRLYAIENGRIAESGTHAELLKKKGIYYKLYALQSEANKKIVIGE